MRERDVERYLFNQVWAAGGRALKFTSPARRGIPDRIVLWPDATIHFIEVKAPGKKANPGQLREHKRLRKFGFKVWIIDSYEQTDTYIASLPRARTPAHSG